MLISTSGLAVGVLVALIGLVVEMGGFWVHDQLHRRRGENHTPYGVLAIETGRPGFPLE